VAGTGRLLGTAALRPWRSVSLEGGILGKSGFSDKPCGGDLPQGGTFGLCRVMVAPGRIRFQGMGGEGSRGRGGPVSSAGKACIIKQLASLTEGEAWVLWSARSFRKRTNTPGSNRVPARPVERRLVQTRRVSADGRIASDGMVLWPRRPLTDSPPRTGLKIILPMKM